MSKPEIVLLGVNHKTAPVEVREKLALKEEDTPPLKLFSGFPGCREAVFLSTCNRVEVIACTESADLLQNLKEFWCSRAGLDPDEAGSALYEYRGKEAVKHLFRVASSLDSMIVGEPQILGQLKDAYRMASEEKSAGMILNRLLHRAFSVAKRIRTETRIASQAVSISYAAVELAKKIFGDLKGKNALLIGAGEMAELAAQHLKTNGVSGLAVANRTLQRAIDLARDLGGTAVSLDELEQELVHADIVISSTGAPGVVVTADQVKSIMRPRRHRLLFFIDIAVPRDIDPAVNSIENVYLYDIDELKEVVEENRAEREKEARKAERMVDEEVLKFLSWMDSLDIVPVIRELMARGEAIRKQELEKSCKTLKDLTKKQQKAVDALTRSIVNKLLHHPVTSIKQCGNMENPDEFIAAACRLFNLEGTSHQDALEEMTGKNSRDLQGCGTPSRCTCHNDATTQAD